MHGVIAQVVAPAQDPLRDLRILLEPGPDGEHRDLRARLLRLDEQRLGDREGSLAMKGERHLRPVSWPVHDLRAELRARVIVRARRRRRPTGGRSSGGRPRNVAAGRLAGLGCARTAGQPGSRDGRAGEKQELPPLDRHLQNDTPAAGLASRASVNYGDRNGPPHPSSVRSSPPLPSLEPLCPRPYLIQTQSDLLDVRCFDLWRTEMTARPRVIFWRALAPARPHRRCSRPAPPTSNPLRTMRPPGTRAREPVGGQWHIAPPRRGATALSPPSPRTPEQAAGPAGPGEADAGS